MHTLHDYDKTNERSEEGFTPYNRTNGAKRIRLASLSREGGR